MNFIEVQDKEIFDFVYSDMEKQFPKSELRPYEKIYLDVFSEKPYKMAVLKNNNDIIGYITYFEKEFIWVDYLAIIGDSKSRGLGSLILKKLFEHYKDKSGAYFEVELENPADSLTTKRINFYQNIGCEVLDFVYFFANETNILRMNLMYKPLANKVPKNIFADVEDIFNNGFNCATKEIALKKMIELNNIGEKTNI